MTAQKSFVGALGLGRALRPLQGSGRSSLVHQSGRRREQGRHSHCQFQPRAHHPSLWVFCFQGSRYLQSAFLVSSVSLPRLWGALAGLLPGHPHHKLSWSPGRAGSRLCPGKMRQSKAKSKASSLSREAREAQSLLPAGRPVPQETQPGPHKPARPVSGHLTAAGRLRVPGGGAPLSKILPSGCLTVDPAHSVIPFPPSLTPAQGGPPLDTGEGREMF